MNYIVRKPWDVPQREHTPPEVFFNPQQHRREFLKTLGIGAAAALPLGLSGCSEPTQQEIESAVAIVDAPLSADVASLYPAKRNAQFEYGRAETIQRYAAQYTNFYEFSPSKESWRSVGDFKPRPWTLEIDGLCAKPMTLDLDDFQKRLPLEERAYRHRCVETWAMCVPWTGFPLAELLKLVEPKAEATHVRFESFNRPDEASQMRDSSMPWPYTEGLTIAEAMNELTLLATGVYGEPLPKQHGAPIRLVVPWKYGFKSAKSIVKISLVNRPPATFWNKLVPHEYGFEANVDPNVPHPRWSQRTEWMLGPDRERYDTVVYNGYGDYVGGLYGV